VRLPYHWLRELVTVPDGPDALAATLGLRGFEVASVEDGAQPVVDFEITANRPDCLSVIGLAREASAAYSLPLTVPDRTLPPAGDAKPLDVIIEDAELCPRYCAQVFEVLSQVASPSWLRERLEAAGVRSISAIVDVTNYVMIEMGHPTHAFDLARLGGSTLRVRRAKRGETIRTLDGIERALEPDMLVIADANRPQAIGGVMGGADSEIGSGARVMVLESAYFKPSSVRRTSKSLGLKTEASTRFERGADINAAPAAIARAAALLHQIGAARPLGAMIDRYPAPKAPLSLTLRSARIARMLGEHVPDGEVPARLEPLGFGVKPVEVSGPRSEVRGPRSEVADEGTGREWIVDVPTFRVDVLREIDLIEEIARHDGYASLPGTFPTLTTPQAAPDQRTLRDRAIKQVLIACGLSEAMTFAFVERAAALPFANGTEPAALANPLSEKYAVLRPSLLPGLIDAASYNRRRERRDIRLFETGARFTPAGENRAVAGVWAGAGALSHWSGGARAVDFFDVKGVVETLCRTLDIDVTFEPVSRPYFVEGRAAAVIFRLKAEGTSNHDDRVATHAGLVAADGDLVAHALRRQPVGELGQIAPAILDARELPPNEALFAFELDVDAIGALLPSGDFRAESLPRFPSVVRDVSILLDAILPAAAVRGTIRSSAPDTLAEVTEFDRYRGKGVPDDRVSLSLRLTFRSPDRTLTDGEVDEAMNRIVAALAAAHGAVRR
jgi:phenylalanyl-tRNA synthetase beta chain